MRSSQKLSTCQHFSSIFNHLTSSLANHFLKTSDIKNRVGSIAAAAFLVLWIIASTVVSAVFTVRYMGIVEEDQAWYLLQGSARTAAAEAKAVMEAAVQAWKMTGGRWEVIFVVFFFIDG